MTIGFCSLFPFRPHVQNLAYLYNLLKREGHTIRVLHSKNDFKLCHYKLLHKQNKSFIPPSFKSQLGSLTNYVEKTDIDNISDIDISNVVNQYTDQDQEASVINSLANIYRIEDYNKVETLREEKEFGLLLNSKVKMSKLVQAWVKREEIDLVILFNGRMDLLDSALGELKKMGIETLCVEGSGTDRGIRVVRNANAVDYKDFDKSLRKVISKPINPEQQLTAFSYLYNRIKGNNTYEWRQYNQGENMVNYEWNSKEGNKVLLLPSSMYEFYGVIDHSTTWDNATDGFDHVLDLLNINPKDVLLRFHPNWSRSINGYDGQQSILFYEKYCKERGINYINSEEKVQTRDLIKEANYIVVNGGSSAIEGALFGKHVINVFPSKYMNAGFVDNVLNKNASIPGDSDEEERHERIRKCLRYLYFNMRVYPRFIDEIISVDAVTNKYKIKNIHIDNVYEKMTTLNLDLYDEESTEEGENAIIDQIKNREFEALGKQLQNIEEPINLTNFGSMEPKRFIAKSAKKLRSKFKKGDLS